MVPPLVSTWINDLDLIELLKYYEETNAFCKDYSIINPLWLEISARAKLTAAYCRKKWLAIKYTYIKLKHMIRIGRVTEDMVQLNPITAKFVDGRLDFLDQFVSDIPDTALPRSVHSVFDSLFGEKTDNFTHSVEAVKLIKLKPEGNDIQVIQDFNQETGTEPTCILPNVEQVIEEESPNDNDSNYIELVTPTPVHRVILPTIQLHQDGSIKDMANLQYVTGSSIQSTTNNPIGDMVNFQYVTTSRIQPTKNEEPSHKRKLGNKTNIEELNKTVNSNLARFLVKYTNSNIETEQTGDLKEYMDDLAEVLCNRLAPRKRKYFLSQIDLIVSEILEG